MLLQHTEVLFFFRSVTDLIVDETQKENHRVGKRGLLGKNKDSLLSDFPFWGGTGSYNPLLPEPGTKPVWAAGHDGPESNFLSASPWHTQIFSEDSRGTL